MSQHHVRVAVNGQVREADVEARLLLVHLLRDVFGLTGTHVGCDTTSCGAWPGAWQSRSSVICAGTAA